MNAITLLRVHGPLDLKNLRRDALLLWMPWVPLLMAGLLRVATPRLAALSAARLALDLTPYYPLVMSFYVVTAPMIAGMVVGFLLLDERDDRTLQALLVTPVPLHSYMLYRVSLPLVVGLGMTLIGHGIAGLVALPLAPLLVVAGLAALTGPLMALLLAAIAANKVVGLAMVKALNAVGLLPVVAYVVPDPWQYLAGALPTFWPAKVYWLAAAGQPFLAPALVGLLVNGLFIAALARRFERVLHR